MEIVTNPMSLEFHKMQMPWKEILDKCISMNYRSHSTNSCGFHTHVNRLSLGDSIEKQDEVISRILYFFEKHFEELLIFSRRSLANLNRWAARYGFKDNPSEIMDQAKKTYNGRYTCVNLMNNATIEFRIFRGTLRLNSLLAAVELVDEICSQALTMSDEDIQCQSWQSFVMNIDKKKKQELIEYLKIRQLYVNEKIESDEDL